MGQGALPLVVATIPVGLDGSVLAQIGMVAVVLAGTLSMEGLRASTAGR
ncbi:MAG TPA: hypothetical protein VFB58_15580 [Chloroflexota bacterium]|nr:hypothetical protein [Chloroflexota bacterium]